MAEFNVLSDGYVLDDGERVASTVGFVRDGGTLVVIDPGMVASRTAILDPLGALEVPVEDVTDVVLSHHHPDHTLNAALFPNARVHDHWAWYRDDRWVEREAEGFEVSPDVRLLATPGHTAQDISTAVRTDDGLVVCTHLWWMASGPPEDPLAEDLAAIHANRQRVLALTDLARIVPGHGPAFMPDASTPR
jgi:glyoxylase-like metal-dependent hydrolase (beta-lactamase superfamily II)